jgi:hypothetical protein
MDISVSQDHPKQFSLRKSRTNRHVKILVWRVTQLLFREAFAQMKIYKLKETFLNLQRKLGTHSVNNIFVNK